MKAPLPEIRIDRLDAGTLVQTDRARVRTRPCDIACGQHGRIKSRGNDTADDVSRSHYPNRNEYTVAHLGHQDLRRP